jgi:hypothetical protein
VGNQTTTRPNSIDVFGQSNSLVLSQTFIAGFSLLKGMTAFKPPVIEYRVAVGANITHVEVPERRVLYVEPSKGTTRTTGFVGLQEAFIDYHIGRFDTKRYDFVSLRAGIQPFQSDFRGFLFNDNQLGVRLFGNRDNNRWQFNLAAFWRIEKDTNSGLNDVTQPLRRDWIFTGNIYRQDFPFVGLTSQVSLTYNMNRENRYKSDKNGFPARPALLGDIRPRQYDVVYIGYAADGHVGRMNLTAQAYAALGRTATASSPAARPSSRRSWRRPKPATTSTGCASAFPACGPAATAIPMTAPKAASTPSSRTRSSPVPIPATGSPVDPVRGRWPRGVAQRPQRHSQFAAHVQGTGPVELPQPRHGAGRGGGISICCPRCASPPT